MNGFNHRDWRHAVMAHEGLTSDQRLILLALGEHADYQTGKRAHPGNKRLAEMTRTSPSTVKRAIAAGLSLGLLVQTGSGRNNGPRTWASTYDLGSVVTHGRSDHGSAETDHGSLQTDHGPVVNPYHSSTSPNNTPTSSREPVAGVDQVSGVTPSAFPTPPHGQATARQRRRADA